jgi:hypothetical protein
MKSQLIKVSVLSLFLMTTSVLSVSAQDQAAGMKSGRQLTKAEAKALSMSRTPQDHLELASYFRNEAREAENMAGVHEEIASGKLRPRLWHDNRIADAQS